MIITRATRGAEVASWRAQQQSVCPYVCLDDDGDFLPGQPLVQTSAETGLTDDDVSRAIALLTNTNW